VHEKPRYWKLKQENVMKTRDQLHNPRKEKLWKLSSNIPHFLLARSQSEKGVRKETMTFQAKARKCDESQ
jgi:hypothetical protein